MNLFSLPDPDLDPTDLWPADEDDDPDGDLLPWLGPGILHAPEALGLTAREADRLTDE